MHMHNSICDANFALQKGSFPAFRRCSRRFFVIVKALIIHADRLLLDHFGSTKDPNSHHEAGKCSCTMTLSFSAPKVSIEIVTKTRHKVSATSRRQSPFLDLALSRARVLNPPVVSLWKFPSRASFPQLSRDPLFSDGVTLVWRIRPFQAAKLHRGLCIR